MPAEESRIGLVSPDEAARLSGIDLLKGMADGTLPSAPVTETAGLRFRSVAPGEVVFEATPSAKFYNPLGIVHGGWIAMLLDSAMGCAVHSTFAQGRIYATIEMSTTFVRAVREETGPLVCRGTALHTGGRLASAEAKIYDAAGRLVAHGSETCMIADVKEPRSENDPIT